MDVKEPHPFKITGRFVVEVEDTITARTPEEAEMIFEQEVQFEPTAGFINFQELSDTYAEEVEEGI